MITHANYLFMLSFNPFPLISSFSFFNFIMGCFFFMKYNFLFMPFSIFSSFLLGILWWVTFSKEMLLTGCNSDNMVLGLKISFLLFISSEIFFFFSFFWSYFQFYLSPLMEFSFSWPPISLMMFEFLDIPLLNTLILLSSGVSITISHFYMMENKSLGSSVFLFITFFLGAIFTFFQYLEYCNSFFSLNDSSFGSVFFLLTGFHGTHVIVGSFYLLFVFSWSFSNYNTINMLSFELSSWYWHFVDVVWIFLFFFVYIFSSY